MVREGDRVEHVDRQEIQGRGTVVTVHECSGMAVVEWDTHGPNRTAGQPDGRRSHVSLQDLRVMPKEDD
jgi:hypothetical protein